MGSFLNQLGSCFKGVKIMDPDMKNFPYPKPRSAVGSTWRRKRRRLRPYRGPEEPIYGFLDFNSAPKAQTFRNYLGFKAVYTGLD